MAVLLDTHAFLRWVDGSTRLSRKARAAIGRPDEACFVSVVSLWEMAIKIGQRRLKVPTRLDRFAAEQIAANGFRPLPIHLTHLARVAELPFHHRDPFDRLLASQALVEDMAVVSADRIFSTYGVRRIW